ncbi:unnamed protein product [Darwinula stevensoni]|uniref:Uncharacterized protein n=1 Tax=Darwinula stevensoni TaxID=69355 RepID=A0A7R9FQ86_9CRUS|nr:unnamed protein product [Darwinula stevensoni]CAG0898749.1 unnamed protein product [Darwinula stevensoni]
MNIEDKMSGEDPDATHADAGEGGDEICSHCARPIPSKSLELHELHCRRSLAKCSLCGDVIPVSQMAQHLSEGHALVHCPYCHNEFQKITLEKHQEECPEQPCSCEYCDLIVPLSGLNDHWSACGSRTDACLDCGKYVQLQNWNFHVQSGHASTAPSGRDSFALGPPTPFGYSPRPGSGQTPPPPIPPPRPSLAGRAAESWGLSHQGGDRQNPVLASDISTENAVGASIEDALQPEHADDPRVSEHDTPPHFSSESYETPNFLVACRYCDAEVPVKNLDSHEETSARALAEIPQKNSSDNLKDFQERDEKLGWKAAFGDGEGKRISSRISTSFAAARERESSHEKRGIASSGDEHGSVRRPGSERKGLDPADRDANRHHGGARPKVRQGSPQPQPLHRADTKHEETAADIVVIPCEFCSLPIPMNHLYWHQEDLKLEEPRRPSRPHSNPLPSAETRTETAEPKSHMASIEPENLDSERSTCSTTEVQAQKMTKRYGSESEEMEEKDVKNVEDEDKEGEKKEEKDEVEDEEKDEEEKEQEKEKKKEEEKEEEKEEGKEKIEEKEEDREKEKVEKKKKEEVKEEGDVEVDEEEGEEAVEEEEEDGEEEEVDEEEGEEEVEEEEEEDEDKEEKVEKEKKEEEEVDEEEGKEEVEEENEEEEEKIEKEKKEEEEEEGDETEDETEDEDEEVKEDDGEEEDERKKEKVEEEKKEEEKEEEKANEKDSRVNEEEWEEKDDEKKKKEVDEEEEEGGKEGWKKEGKEEEKKIQKVEETENDEEEEDDLYEDTCDDPFLLPFLQLLEDLDAISSDEEIMGRLHQILSEVPADASIDTDPCRFCSVLLPLDDSEIHLHETGCGRKVLLGRQSGDLSVECRYCNFFYPLEELPRHETSCRAGNRQVSVERDGVFPPPRSMPPDFDRSISSHDLLPSVFSWLRRQIAESKEIFALGAGVSLQFLPWSKMLPALGVREDSHWKLSNLLEKFVFSIFKRSTNKPE